MDIKMGLEIKKHICTKKPLGESAKKMQYVTSKYLNLFHLPEELATNMKDLRLRLATSNTLIRIQWTRRGSGTFTSDEES